MIIRFITMVMIFSLFSCYPIKNEYNMPRMKKHKFSLTANIGEENKVGSIIDLNVIYKKIKVKNVKYNKELTRFKVRYLKFYKNGKVGIFTDKTIEEINPLKADMGIYEYKNSKLYYEFFFHTAQAGYVRHKAELLLEGNYLMEKNKEYIDTYEIIPIKQESIIKPDW